jgi:formyl-CoA transferase
MVVADFSRVLAGPLATMTLADLGATVIKVERPGSGDDTRAWGPPWTATSSSYFESVNRSKLSVTLDLADDHDLGQARALANRADVLVENFRTGSLDRYGLGPDTLRRTNPALVYCSVTGFGSGAGAALPGYDFVVQALGGLMSITGAPDGDPMKVGVALVDVLTGKDAVIGILAALRDRERDGLGQHIEVNLLSSLLGGLVNQASGFLASGIAPRPMGNQHPSIAPYETLRCKDGLLAVACGNDRQFRSLTEVLGDPALADDERFTTNARRVGNRAELVTTLEELLSVEAAETWESRLVGAGVPVGRVGDIASAIALAERLGLQPTVDVGDDAPPQVAHPIRYSKGSVPTKPVAPPRLGQHDDPVRAWLAAGPGTPPPPPPSRKEHP